MGKRFFSVMSAVCVLLMTAGCGGVQKNSAENSRITLTYWTPMTEELDKTCKSMNDTELYRELEKRTGVDIEFIHPPLGQEAESFQMLIASAESPDIYGYFPYPGNTQKALEDGVILPLNGYMEEYAPNLTAVLKAHPEWDKEVKNDDGIYDNFPFIHGDPFLCIYAGPMVRQDWLNDLGLEIPRTVAEWENVLLRFKEEKGAETPFSVTDKYFRNYEILTGAYGTSHGMFLADGDKVTFGPAQPAYRQYLETVKRWIDMGLLDREFITIDPDAVRVKMLKGQVGMTVGPAGKDMGGYISEMKKIDADFELAPVPYPSLEPGQRAILGQRVPEVETGCYISALCKHPEEAMRFLDYGYGEEGHMLFNFGIENVSYTMQNGNPVYTDEITDNPKGLSVDEALSRYVRANYYGPFVQDRRYIEQFYALPQQKEAVKVWSETDAEQHMVPGRKLTVEENERYSDIMAGVSEYCNSMYLKFILGQESLENFDAYVQHIYNLGCEEAENILQNAVNRYRNR